MNGGGTGGSHAGSAFQGGNKIAYDPRDLEDIGAEQRKVGGKMPKLTIMEEILLLGIKDKQVQPNRFVSIRVSSFIRRDTFHSGTTTFHTL